MQCEDTACMVIQMSIRTYSEVITIPSFEDRYEYLRLDGRVGQETFGHDRYLNQILYTSQPWRRFRDKIIIRDNGCDLACEGYEVRSFRDRDGKIHRPKILIHHINPITVDDVINNRTNVFDPENVICVTHNTHQAIHYGDSNLLFGPPIERSQNDTCPWRH